MEPKTMFNIFGSFPNFPRDVKNSEEQNVFSRVTYSGKRSNCKFQDLQIFTEHLKLSDRFKRTLYYGKLPKTECPSLPLTDVTLELFTKTVPNGGLDILDMHYASSVSRKACISPCSMILAMMYLEQLRLKNPEYLQNVSSCDLFLISMLVASKYLYDNGEEDEVFNAEWASSANIDVKELNTLEREFLSALKWEVYAKPSTFFSILRNIECQIAFREASKRGWFTYTDLWILSEGSGSLGILSVLVENFIKVMVISVIAYIAAALTILGASAVSQKSIVPVKAVLQSVLISNDADNCSFSLPRAFLVSSDSEIQTSLVVTDKFSSFTSNILCTKKECPFSKGNETLPHAQSVFQVINSKTLSFSNSKDQFRNNQLCELRVKMVKMELLVDGLFSSYHRKDFRMSRKCNKTVYCNPVLTTSLSSSETWWFLNPECSSQPPSDFYMNYLLRSCQKFVEVSLQA